MEILEFIFRDFWTFCGVVILIYVIGAYCITAPILMTRVKDYLGLV